MRGASVASGYWERPEVNAEVFGARITGHEELGPWLRTGDMGVLDGGEFFVTGSLKEMVLINGRNIYPYDVESAVRGLAPAIGAGAVFAVDTGGQEHLVVIDGAPDASRLDDYTRRIADVPGVESVGTPVELDDRHWEIDAVLTDKPLDDTAKDAVAAVQDLAAPYPARYTGTTADFLAQRESIADSLPLAGGILVVVTLLLLFAFSGSVVLPLKALLMNLLSTGAAFGFLVWIFQNGNFGFPAQNGLETTTPVLVFALAFGLSTDYNVFLLSRIKEARAQGLDNREAVAQGLSRTGGIVTSAAVLFCIPVGALALSRLVFIQELGLGAAFAVLIDATVVRAFLVPSLMALLGTANWWAPAPLRSLHRALRLDRTEHTTEAAPAPKESTPVA